MAFKMVDHFYKNYFIGYGPEKQFYFSIIRFAITPILKIQMAANFSDLDRVFKELKTKNYSSNNHCSRFVKCQ